MPYSTVIHDRLCSYKRVLVPVAEVLQSTSEILAPSMIIYLFSAVESRGGGGGAVMSLVFMAGHSSTLSRMYFLRSNQVSSVNPTAVI